MTTEHATDFSTRLTQVGRSATGQYVNPPIVRASTVLASSLADWRSRARLPTGQKPTAAYGRFGTPTTLAFEGAVAELENAWRSICFPSGLAACTHTLLALARPGSHVLITSSVYWPVREFAMQTLTKLNVQVEFFNEIDAANIAAKFRLNTTLVYLESPGSATFEISEVDAIAAACARGGIKVVIDNTWATPALFRPLDHGVDVSIHSATKYICGHSDCVLGVASCTRAVFDQVCSTAAQFGQTASPDDLYQGLRGLRTLDVRIRQHGETAEQLARWLATRPEVARVLSPSLHDHPGHAAWRRLYSGSSGLFAFVMKPVPESVLEAFFDSLSLFGIGLSWGGFESLMVPLPSPDTLAMSAVVGGGQLIRVHAGLESAADLRNDIEVAFDAMHIHSSVIHA